MSDEIDISPSTEILKAWRNQNLRFSHVFGELIDNSFDAGASLVRIAVSGKDLIVTDNGDGCGDLRAMLTAGRHVKQSGTRLGRFGVGLKDSAIWLGGETRIRSVNRGVVRTVVANWDEVARSHQWRIPAPVEADADAGDVGTRILFSQTIRSIPSGKAFDDLVAEIGYLFSPAIKDGRRIEFVGKNKKLSVAPRFYLPDLEHVVNRQIMVDGKMAHVNVGVVPEGSPNPKPGISYTHGFRVIIPATGLGCGGRNFSRVSGWVSLDGEWKLNKNKDGVNVDEDLLGDAVFDVIKDVVDRAARQSMTVKSAALSQNLTAMLRGMVTDGDARRDRTGEKPGTVSPKDTGRRHRNATKARPGTTRRVVEIGRMSIDFKPCDQPAIGSVDVRGHMVWLADNHPWVARLRSDENLDALISVAMFLIGSVDPEEQRAFKWFKSGSGDTTVEQRVGLLLNDQPAPAELRVVA